MDTISINIYGSKEELEKVANLIEMKKDKFRGIKILRSNDIYLTLKISYPKYYSKSNGYLITSERECQEVQEAFLVNLFSYGIDIDQLEYKVNRVDIPFTFLMLPGEKFSSYLNIFHYMALISKKGHKSNKRKSLTNIKGIENFVEGEIETITFSSDPNAKSSKRKIIIYNQCKRLEDTYKQVSKIKEIKKEFPDLPRRIRLEVMNVNRSNERKPLSEFMDIELYTTNFENYKQQLLDLLDEEILIEILNEESKKYFESLKERPSTFTWEKYCLANQTGIKSYPPFRSAVKKLGLSKKGEEQAVTKLRKALNEIEYHNGIMIMDTVNKLNSMRGSIERIKLK